MRLVPAGIALTLLVGVACATTSPTSSSISPATSTVPPPAEGPGPFGVEVFTPTSEGPWPVAVVVHGGGWMVGGPESTQPLAEALAEAGVLAFNASYRTGAAGGGFPQSFDDVACAVRFASEQAEGLPTSGEMALMGHSAGAHLAAVATLRGADLAPECPWTGSVEVDRFIGLAGIYRLDAVEDLMIRFLGGDRDVVPEAWAVADPFENLDRAGEVDALLVHGTADRVVPPRSSEELAEAWEGAGATVRVELVQGADHIGLLDPAQVVDRLDLGG